MRRGFIPNVEILTLVISARACCLGARDGIRWWEPSPSSGFIPLLNPYGGVHPVTIAQVSGMMAAGLAGGSPRAGIAGWSTLACA